MIDPLADAPLRGRRIVLTRARGEANALRRSLEDLGAEVFELPTIDVGAPDDPGPLERAVRTLDRYDWIAFASRHAVQAVFQQLDELALSPVFPAGLKVAAVGDATAAEVERRDVTVDCVPATPSASALASALIERGIRGARVLLPAGDLARRELPDGLRGAGALVDEVQAYRIVPPADVDSQVLSLLAGEVVDAVVLASPSAFHNLRAMLPAGVFPPRTVRMACMGPTTASAVRAAGIENAIVADPVSRDGLVRAIVRSYTQENQHERIP